jgi:hypothetical protein
MNGTVGATTASTGLFTTIGATGLISGVDARWTTGANTLDIQSNPAALGVPTIGFNTAGTIGTGSAFIYGNSSRIVINGPTSGTVSLRVANTAIADVTSTGLAVTGALSATTVVTAGLAKIGTGFAGLAEFTNTTDFGAAGTYSFLSEAGGLTYINAKSGQSISLRIANSEKVNVSSAGLGIGTASPIEKLEIYGNDVGTIITNFTASVNSAGYQGRKARGTSSSPTQVLADDQITGLFGKGYHSGGAFGTANVGALTFYAAENFTATAQGTYFTVGTTATGANSRTERMRITSAGSVGIGTTAPASGSKLHVVAASGLTGAFFQVGANGNYAIEMLNASGSRAGYIQVDAAGTGTTYNSGSDVRLKKNIKDAPSASEIIEAIKVRSFDWKSSDTHQRFGFVAQEVDEIYPEAVSKGYTEEDTWGIDYGRFTPILIAEIQALRQRVAALENP